MNLVKVNSIYFRLSVESKKGTIHPERHENFVQILYTTQVKGCGTKVGLSYKVGHR